MQTVKPTKYNGYNFRSRTEARWAVFFDALGIKYHYEHEDFVLPTGERYLPDFYLPSLNAYAEVKGSNGFNDIEMKKCRYLCDVVSMDILLLTGPPDFTSYLYYSKYGANKEHLFKAAVQTECGGFIPVTGQRELSVLLTAYPFREDVVSYWYGAELIEFIFFPIQSRIWVHPEMDDKDIEDNAKFFGFAKGVYAARGYQFEFKTS